jgi:hypothetical protein
MGLFIENAQNRPIHKVVSDGQRLGQDRVEGTGNRGGVAFGMVKMLWN